MNKSIYTLRFFIAFLPVVFLSSAFTGFSQSGDAGAIRLKSGILRPLPNARQWLDSFAASKPSEPAQVLIHFTTLPPNEQRETLQQAGITLLSYLPENTFVALVRYPISQETVLSQHIHSFVNMNPAWKASSYLWKQVASKKGAVEILVSFYGDISAAAVKQYVESMGGSISNSPMARYGAYKVIIDAGKISGMARWYGVRSISPVSPIVSLDLDSRPSVKGNVAVAAPQYGGYGLKGDGVTVGVGDDASGIYHADIRDRITNFNPAARSNHGEHVNGIVGGTGNIDPLAECMAPHVSLIDFFYDLILPATGDMYHDYNMTITNNSYEIIADDCGYAGAYDAYSQFVDSLAIQYPYVLDVFASGNDGAGTCSPYPQGFATVGGGYQPAKNNVVVGSMTDFYSEVSDESRGPVKDGRIKPEIEATGLVAYSTVGIDQYEWAAGTSMASPHVAGGLAELTQRYKQLNAGAQPRADLLKAILLNGAMDLGNPGPDYTHGFGEMDLYRSLQIIDSAHYTAGDISNSDSQSFTINVPPGTGQLRVMLYWADVPASAYAASELVNDLDVKVYDPSGAAHLPLVLDTLPANVNNNATEKEDHINNIEQVTINNPTPGAYVIKTNGYNIPYGPQHYVIAWDDQPKALHLTYPMGGEQLISAGTPFDTLRIFWDAISDGNTFKVETSQDNGATWTTASDTIPANWRYYGIIPSGLSTGNYRVRVSRNNTSETASSGRLSFNALPIIGLDSAQCPGYINIHWSPVLNATGYYMVRKVGYYMQVVDSATDTTYSFSGMPLTDYSYVSVQPIIDGIPGYRAVALKAMANTGNCTLPVSSGDLMIQQVIAPVSGRRYTSSQLSAAATLQLQLADLYASPCTSYSVSWQVNSGPWQTATTPATLPAAGSVIVSIPGLNLAAPGTYIIRAAVHNLALPDPQPGNDTVTFTILNLPNDTINLAAPLLDGFESMPVFGITHDSVGISPNGYWDFFTADSGRLRTFLNDAITITGARSISLDAVASLQSGSGNSLTGTFNLSNFDTATAEIRIDFDYILHGKPKSATGNIVTARANDTASWATFYNYNLAAYPGFVTPVRSLSLTDLTRLSHHNFSASAQVSFGQSDTSLIAAIDFGNGMTIDNFRMYTVSDDAAFTGIISPVPNSCGLPASGPLTVQVSNGVNYTLHNVQLFYNVDGGPALSGTVDSLLAKSTVSYTFPQQIDMTPGVSHTLNVWLSEAGDTYPGNDSILSYQYRNSQVIANYPYLENFESGKGGYYSGGYRDSWQYGTPASFRISKAASGTMAWKTNLTGNYNNLELSYLYAPCFDLSGLAQPMLSFSEALSVENCGSSLCDAAYIEVSYDGVTWIKLGSSGQGTNWYDSTFDVWNTENFTRWHVASILLPQPGAGYTTHLRFVMSADPGVTFDGIAIDDIHIFDLVNPIYQPTESTGFSKDLSANLWTDYTLKNYVLASIDPGNQQLTDALMVLFTHDTLHNPGATQYTFPRSYQVSSSPAPPDSVGVRLYLLDSDVVAVLKDTTCPSCTPVTDAYSLGITQYHNPLNTSLENGTLNDDTGGIFTFRPYRSITWVPYDQGYYAEFNAIPLSEFWFSNGGPTGNFPAGVDYLNFTAWRNGSDVTCLWHSLIDTAVSHYTLQWSTDSINYGLVIDTQARHIAVADYTVNDPVNFSHFPVFYYRLKWTLNGSNTVYYSPVRRVDSSDSSIDRVNFTARMVDHRSILAGWTSYVDGITDHYILERAIGDYAFTTIDNAASLRHFGQQYYYTDQLTEKIATGTRIHYRLTAVLDDGSRIVLPEQTVEWINGNTFAEVYPNPSRDGRFSIAWYADAGTTMQISVTDLLGRVLYRSSFTAGQWSNISTFQPAGHISSGLYTLRMNIGGQEQVTRLIVE